MNDLLDAFDTPITKNCMVVDLCDLRLEETIESFYVYRAEPAGVHYGGVTLLREGGKSVNGAMAQIGTQDSKHLVVIPKEILNSGDELLVAFIRLINPSGVDLWKKINSL